MTPSTLSDLISKRILHKAAPEDSVRKACIIMSTANIGALPIVNAHGFLLGIISERDVIKRSVIVYRPSEETPVSQVMTPDPKFLPPEATASEAVDLMMNGRFRHLPVCKDGIVVGMVSIRDFNFQSGEIILPPRRATTTTGSARAS